jgi:CRISPR-associated endonuclease/helicase Cas3
VGILAKSWEAVQANTGALSESDLLNLVEQVYEGNDLSQNNAFLQIKSQTQQEQVRLAGVLDSPRPEEDNNSLVTRLIEYEQLSVIPSRYESTVVECEPKDRRRYEFKMPVWYAKDRGEFKPEINARICQMIYDDYLGGQCLPSEPRDGTQVDEPGFYIM